MLKSAAVLALFAVLLAALGACASVRHSDLSEGDGESISIPYDPYNYDPDELLSEAQAHCEAYGRTAVYVDETIDPSSVRWRYRHFDCV